MPAALELCEEWWNAQECRQVPIDDEVRALFPSWMHELKLGRKQLLDTLLAAAYHRAGVRRLATTDWRDFARYGVSISSLSGSRYADPLVPFDAPARPQRLGFLQGEISVRDDCDTMGATEIAALFGSAE